MCGTNIAKIVDVEAVASFVSGTSECCSCQDI